MVSASTYSDRIPMHYKVTYNKHLHESQRYATWVVWPPGYSVMIGTRTTERGARDLAVQHCADFTAATEPPEIKSDCEARQCAG